MSFDRFFRIKLLQVRLLIVLLLAAFSLHAQTKTLEVPADFVIKNATVMTASHGTIERGSVWVHQGKIAGVGEIGCVPAEAVVIDATGKFLTPGIVDPHPHPLSAMM